MHEPIAPSTVPGRRVWPIDPLRARLAAALCWAGFAVVVVMTLGGHADAFDSWGLRLWRKADMSHAGPAWMLESVRDVTALGGVTLRIGMTAAAVAALLFMRLRREALMLALIAAGGWAFNTMLKWLFARERPSIVSHLTEAGGHGFPSGHSFNSAAGFIAIALVLAALGPRPAGRVALIAGAVALSLLIALSRVALGVHYPTDILAGWLGGAGWALTAAPLLHRPAAGNPRLAG